MGDRLAVRVALHMTQTLRLFDPHFKSKLYDIMQQTNKNQTTNDNTAEIAEAKQAVADKSAHSAEDKDNHKWYLNT